MTRKLIAAGAIGLMLSAASLLGIEQASADTYNGPRTGGGDAEFLYISKSHIAGLSNDEGDAGLISWGRRFARSWMGAGAASRFVCNSSRATAGPTRTPRGWLRRQSSRTVRSTSCRATGGDA